MNISKCPRCLGTGKYFGIGMMLVKCDNCSCLSDKKQSSVNVAIKNIDCTDHEKEAYKQIANGGEEMYKDEKEKECHKNKRRPGRPKKNKVYIS